MKRFYWLLMSSGLLAGPQAQAQTAPAQPPAGSMAAPAPTGPWTLQAAVDYALHA